MNPSFRMVKIFSLLMVVLLAPSAWAQSSGFTVVASGLDGPRGLKFGPDGALYGAEAGSGGDTLSSGFSCEQVPSPVGPYHGRLTARVSRIRRGPKNDGGGRTALG
jgi:hypothetical protein